MLDNLLNQEAPIKKFIKRQLPKFKHDLSCMLDDLFLQVADSKEQNPFELLLILSRKEDKALGSFYDAQKTCLGRIDAGAIIEDLFLKQLAMVPTAFKETIMADFGTESASQTVVEALKNKRLLIYYDKQDELVFIEMTKTGKRLIDIDEFIQSFEF